MSRAWGILLIGLGLLIHGAYWASFSSQALNGLAYDTAYYLPGTDFYGLYQSGYEARHGRSIYQPATEVVVGPHPQGTKYLPDVTYTLGILASLLPSSRAYRLWLLIIEACTLLALVLIWRWRTTCCRRAFATFLWLAWFPIYQNLHLGQFSLTFAVLVLWSMSLAAGGRWTKSAWAWIASVLFKPLSILLLPYYWFSKQRAWILVLLGLLALNLSYFLFFPQDLWTYASVASPESSDYAGSYGLATWLRVLCQHGAWRVLTTSVTVPGHVLDINWLAILAAVVAVAVALAQTRGVRKEDWPRAFALWTCAFFLASGRVWEHHYLFLLPALSALLLEGCLPLRWLVPLAVWLGLPTTFAIWQAQPTSYASQALYHGTKPLGVILLFLFIAFSPKEMRVKP